MTDHISHRNTRYLGRLATACGTALLAIGLAANAAGRARRRPLGHRGVRQLHG